MCTFAAAKTGSPVRADRCPPASLAQLARARDL